MLNIELLGGYRSDLKLPWWMMDWYVHKVLRTVARLCGTTVARWMGRLDCARLNT